MPYLALDFVGHTQREEPTAGEERERAELACTEPDKTNWQPCDHFSGDLFLAVDIYMDPREIGRAAKSVGVQLAWERCQDHVQVNMRTRARGRRRTGWLCIHRGADEDDDGDAGGRGLPVLR